MCKCGIKSLKISKSKNQGFKNAEFTLNGLDNQEQNLTFVKTDF